MFLQIILIAIVILCIFIYIAGKNNENYWRQRNVKFDTTNKVTGVFWSYLTQEGAMFEKYSELYMKYKEEPAVGIGSFVTPALFVIHPKNVQQILETDFNSFYHRGFEPIQGDQLTDNILFMNGPRWKLMRQNMSPLFTAMKLKNMYYIMDKSAQDFVTYLKNNPQYWKQGSFETITTFCNAAVCGSIFGITSESIFDSPFLKMAKDINEPTLMNTLKFSISNLSSKLTKILGIKLFNQYEKFFIGAITKVIQEREKTNVKKHDFADICVSILKNGTMRDANTKTELEPTYGLLAAQAMFFLIAGVEPVAVVIFSTLVELGRNKDILDKVHKEIDDAFEKHGKTLSYDIITEMTYVDQVLSESMRKNPPVGYITRQCVKDTVLQVGNIKVEKGTKVFTPVYNIHNDPNIYAEPEIFDPERFSKENKHNDEFYMPFGLGARMCIGARYSKLQMAAGLVHLLRYFTIKTTEIGGAIKFKRHINLVRPVDVDIEFIPRINF